MSKKSSKKEIDRLTRELMIDHIEDFFREQKLPIDDPVRRMLEESVRQAIWEAVVARN